MVSYPKISPKKGQKPQFLSLFKGNYVFEVGSLKKGNSQITRIKKGLIVKDDIEYGQPGVIPLWYFGLNY